MLTGGERRRLLPQPPLRKLFEDCRRPRHGLQGTGGDATLKLFEDLRVRIAGLPQNGPQKPKAKRLPRRDVVQVDPFTGAPRRGQPSIQGAPRDVEHLRAEKVGRLRRVRKSSRAPGCQLERLAVHRGLAAKGPLQRRPEAAAKALPICKDAVLGVPAIKRDKPRAVVVALGTRKQCADPWWTPARSWRQRRGLFRGVGSRVLRACNPLCNDGVPVAGQFRGAVAAEDGAVESSEVRQQAQMGSQVLGEASHCLCAAQRAHRKWVAPRARWQQAASPADVDLTSSEGIAVHRWSPHRRYPQRSAPLQGASRRYRLRTDPFPKGTGRGALLDEALRDPGSQLPGPERRNRLAFFGGQGRGATPRGCLSVTRGGCGRGPAYSPVSRKEGNPWWNRGSVSSRGKRPRNLVGMAQLLPKSVMKRAAVWTFGSSSSCAISGSCEKLAGWWSDHMPAVTAPRSSGQQGRPARVELVGQDPQDEVHPIVGGFAALQPSPPEPRETPRVHEGPQRLWPERAELGGAGPRLRGQEEHMPSTRPGLRCALLWKPPELSTVSKSKGEARRPRSFVSRRISWERCGRLRGPACKRSTARAEGLVAGRARRRLSGRGAQPLPGPSP